MCIRDRDDNKVKVTFEEAKNDKDEDFTTDHADTYKAVYYVEPVNQEHPKYQISRKLIVREKETEVQTETAGSEAVTESETAGSEQQTEEAEDSESDSEITDIDADEFDDLVEQAQNQDTYDEESGLELHDVLEQAGDEGVDLDSMEEGEIATFEAVSAYSARSTQPVSYTHLTPAITIEKPDGWKQGETTIAVTVDSSHMPEGFSIAKIEAKAGKDGSWQDVTGSGSITITGNQTVYVRVTDGEGKVYEQNRSIKCYDTEKPTLSASLTDGVLTIQGNDTVSGITAVTVNGTTYTDLKDGMLRVQLTQKDFTTKQIEITVTDEMCIRDRYLPGDKDLFLQDDSVL